jgi:hypothetical protein
MAQAAETLEQREDRMLHKSFLDDVTLTKLSNGAYATRSAKTSESVVYITTTEACTCPWSQHNPDRPCKHIARVRFEESLTEPPTPAAPQPKPIVTEAFCAACNGFGWYTMVELSGGRRYEARETCDFCRGHGKLAA